MESREQSVPYHVAIIMDGNGRWAKMRGLPRIAGHQAGVQAVRRAVEACNDVGIRMLTLYTFSNENWGRPKLEVDFLMELCRNYAEREIPDLRRNGIRVRVIGRRAGLSAALLDALDRMVRETDNGERLTLNVALNYGGRTEIVDAARALVRAVRRGEIDMEQLDEATFERFLYTAGLPDPEMVIRTSGEQRISNFLLWQTANAFLWSTPAYWPDFSREHLLGAIRAWRAEVQRHVATRHRSGEARQREHNMKG